MNLEFGTYTLFWTPRREFKIKGAYLARRGDVDEGGVLVVVILVGGSVRTLGRAERLRDPWGKAVTDMLETETNLETGGEGGSERERAGRGPPQSPPSFAGSHHLQQF